MKYVVKNSCVTVGFAGAFYQNETIDKQLLVDNGVDIQRLIDLGAITPLEGSGFIESTTEVESFGELPKTELVTDAETVEDELMQCGRKELNTMAAEWGVENPEKMRSKGEVVKAIREAEASASAGDNVEDSGSDEDTTDTTINELFE